MTPIRSWLRRKYEEDDPKSPPGGVDARQSSAVQVGNRSMQVNSQVTIQVPPRPVEPWPLVEGEPPMLATAFQERPAAEQQLESALAPTGSTIVVTQVLSGDGGIGKTQLAAKAFERASSPRAYDLCLWITAASREAIITWYARVMGRIEAETDADDPNAAAQRFLTWLRETKIAWFIVFDDLADPSDIEGLWPAGPTGRTLVTTRRRDSILSEHGRTVVSLGVFEPTEARAYLANRLSTAQARRDAVTGAGELAEALGYLPLALSQASAVIIDDGITCEQYRARFTHRSTTLIGLFPSSVGQRQRTVSATWSLAIDAADRFAPLGFCRRLLTLIAVLSANGIPESVLTARAVQAFVAARTASHVSDAMTDEAMIHSQRSALEQQHQALRALHRLSLIVHDPTDPARSVRMHALAQRATREAVDDKTRQLAYAAGADALIQGWPEIEKDGVVSSVLRQNATTLADLAGEILWTPRAHPILFRAGHSMEEVGLVGAAVNYWKEMLTISGRTLGASHPDTLAIRREIAYSQGQSGDPLGAAAAFEDLLTDIISAMGPYHPDTLTVRRDLAWWQGETRDPAGAVEACEQLLDDMLRVLGPDDTETLNTRYSLGRWRGQAGEPDHAVAYFRALLHDCIRVVGPEDPLTLAVRHDLAWWLGEGGDAISAVAAFDALLPDRERVLGPDHPYTLATRHDLGWWKWDTGDQEGARSDLEAVLVDYLRVMGPEHPQTAAVRDDLDFLIKGGQHRDTHGRVRDTPGRVPGDLPGLDFLQPAHRMRYQ